MGSPHPSLASLGRKIRHSREDRGWSRATVAELAQISPRFLADLEAGRANISFLRLLNVIQVLGLSLSSACEYPRTPLTCGVALLGLRGAGKSTCGPKIANELGLPFVELNDKIQELAGLGTPEIFSLHGGGFYRKLAREALSHLATPDCPKVVALPGGLVEDEPSFSLTQRCFTTVWLKADPEQHWERVIQQGDSRPMAGLEAPMQELRGLLLIRESLYRLADLTVDTSAGISKTVECVIGELHAEGWFPTKAFSL
jgi:XRE family aerobic/anaerobic benzoate catabolism transcriptional regulator